MLRCCVLGLCSEDVSDEVGELIDGVGGGESGAPTVVEFHVARVGLVVDDGGRFPAGDAPLGA